MPVYRLLITETQSFHLDIEADSEQAAELKFYIGDYAADSRYDVGKHYYNLTVEETELIEEESE